MSSNADILPGLLHLVRVLLCSVPQDRVTPLLRAAYLDRQALTLATDESTEQQESILNKSSMIPYYVFLINVDFRHHSQPNQGIFYNSTLSNKKKLNDELDHGGHVKRYLVEDVNNCIHYKQESTVIARGAAEDLRKDLTWALCANTEGIRTLVIPVSDISRYLEQVHRFKVLSDVTFLLDKDTFLVAPHVHEITQSQDETSLQPTERIPLLEEMLSFVQEHQRLHFSLLTIDDSNWSHFVAKVQETDLSFVKDIHPSFRSGPTNASWKQLAAGEPFLHHCRALENISMPSLGDNTFHWAVHERKQHSVDIAAGRIPQQQLVPLRRFEVIYEHFSTGRQVNDVLFAFSESLESLLMTHLWYSDEFDSQQQQQQQQPQEQLEFSIGYSHNSNFYYSFPVLSSISAGTYDFALRLHPDFLRRCPRLVNIDLEDGREVYSLHETVHWKPADLPFLRHIKLEGTPATSFHPDTLRTTSGLASLDLGMPHEEQFSFIPPPQEFVEIKLEQQQQQQQQKEKSEIHDGEQVDSIYNNSSYSNNNSSPTPSLTRRPIWTWDWDLPCLTSLRLTSEFGYRFQFRMLGGTPNLVSLLLNICSTTGRHKRIIAISDLLRPGYHHPDLGDFLNETLHNNDKEEDKSKDKVWLDFEYIYLPKLTGCYFDGPWQFEGGRVLQVLFGRVAPGIMTLSMIDSSGYDLFDVVHSTSKHLHNLRTVYAAGSTSADAVVEAGLKVVSESDRLPPSYQLIRQPEGRTYEHPATRVSAGPTAAPRKRTSVPYFSLVTNTNFQPHSLEQQGQGVFHNEILKARATFSGHLKQRRLTGRYLEEEVLTMS
ncbi:hypothetical protein BG015_006126 [Linnemannia schmuckeri]|uniref:Uncharacterized protein n=1 Tax=Linnemannia schmuckeri TaxID=64567 RepID=A0A9P5S3L9_9FUNG|nr:hypothetical protein BG015_006126 [Linnemannia schmuckeri]